MKVTTTHQMRFDWNPVSGIIQTTPEAAAMEIVQARRVDPFSRFRVQYIATGYQAQVRVLRSSTVTRFIDEEA